MTEKNIPNKCHHCGLLVHYDFKNAMDTQASDLSFGEMRELFDEGVIDRKFTRALGVSNVPGEFGSTQFCAVSSKSWNKNDEKCRYWQPHIDGALIADYIAIHHNQRALKAAVWFGIGAIVATLIAGVLSIVD